MAEEQSKAGRDGGAPPEDAEPPGGAGELLAKARAVGERIAERVRRAVTDGGDERQDRSPGPAGDAADRS